MRFSLGRAPFHPYGLIRFFAQKTGSLARAPPALHRSQSKARLTHYADVSPRLNGIRAKVEENRARALELFQEGVEWGRNRSRFFSPLSMRLARPVPARGLYQLN